MRLYSMTKTLEVIVTSAKEARDAQEGGADRLELAHSLEDEGLTPAPEVVEDVLRAVSIPVRVILRDSPSFELGDQREITRLLTKAEAFARARIEGLILGFIKHGALDRDLLKHILSAVPNVQATFHRAFEHLHEPFEAIEQLKHFTQVDRILTNGGEGSWDVRKERLRAWQKAAAPQIKIVVGGGLTAPLLSEFATDPAFTEFHAGRAARNPPLPSGVLGRAQVAALKHALA